MKQWYHATLSSPVNTTITQAIKNGYFDTWPNLTIDLINNHLPPLMEKYKCHMHQTRKSINSTNQQEPIKLEEPPMKPLAQRTNTEFTNIINHKRKIGTDITGKCPVTSNRVNKYLFLSYEYDSNSILILPMKAISDSELIWVFKDLYEHLLNMGIKPAYMKMDNEDPPAFQI